MKYLFLLFSSLFLLIPLDVGAETKLMLYPTDDAYVVTDLSDPQDTTGLQKINTGDLEFLKVWYGWNVTQNQNRLLSPALLKFDLSSVSEDQIISAKLRMYAQQVTITTDTKPVGIFLLANSTWTESTLTYQNSPRLTELVSSQDISTPNWYEWDVTSAIQNNTGTQLNLAVFYQNLSQNTEELIVFSSKDSENDNSPTLMIDLLPTKEFVRKKIFPTDDAFVANDFADPADTLGITGINTGDRELIQTWYSRNVTQSRENIATIGYLKFDVSEFTQKDILSASLNLYPYEIATSGADRTISVFKIDDDNWNESTLNFTNRPITNSTELDYISINAANRWHSWDITNALKDTDSQITLAIVFKDFMLGHEEQILFHSKDAANKETTPYLELIYKTPDDSPLNYTTLAIIGISVVAGVIAAAFIKKRGK